MANKKISALPSATTPLAGTEVLPVVQSSTTDQVSVANLTAGRTVEMLNGFLKTTVDVAGATTTYTMGACPSVPTGGALIKSVRTTTSGANHEVVIANVRSGVMNDNFKVDENGNIVALLNNVQINTAAKGVNFIANTPAAGMTSQLLNWYEEGTWTPNQGSGLTVVGTFSSSGTYTRVGRQVTVQGTVSGSTSVAIAAATFMICTNLPFAASAAFAGGMFNSTVTGSGIIAISVNTVYATSAMSSTPLIAFSATYTV